MLGPLGHPSRSARPPPHVAVCGSSDGLTKPLRSCRLGNGTFGRFPFGKVCWGNNLTPFCIDYKTWRRWGGGRLYYSEKLCTPIVLKGVFAKNERGYRLNAIKKRFLSLLILLLYVASIRRKLLKTTKIEERSVHTNAESCNIQLGS